MSNVEPYVGMTHIQDLPTDIFNVIFSFLTLTKLFQCRLVSRKWNTIISYLFSETKSLCICSPSMYTIPFYYPVNPDYEFYKNHRYLHFKNLTEQFPELAELLLKLKNQEQGSDINDKSSSADDDYLGLDVFEMLEVVNKFIYKTYRQFTLVALKNRNASVSNLASYHRVISQYNIDSFDPKYRLMIAKPLNEDIAYSIKKTFPKVCHLEIIENRADTYQKGICALIDAYQTTLKSLKVITHSDSDRFSTKTFPYSYCFFFYNLGYSLNQCTKLKNLVLYDSNVAYPSCFLSSLTKLANSLKVFYTNSCLKNLLTMFNTHVPFKALTEFGIIPPEFGDGFLITHMQLDILLHANPDIFNRYKKLSLPLANFPFCRMSKGGLSQLEKSEITYLKLNSFNIVHKPQNILPVLVQLKKLNYLRLGFGEVISHNNFFDFCSASLTHFRLTSLKTLHLDCQIIPHFEFALLGDIFPNLTTIILEGSPAYRCTSGHCQFRLDLQKKKITEGFARPFGVLSTCVDNFAIFAASFSPQLTTVISKVPNGIFTKCYDQAEKSIVFQETKFTFCKGVMISVKTTTKHY